VRSGNVIFVKRGNIMANRYTITFDHDERTLLVTANVFDNFQGIVVHQTEPVRKQVEAERLAKLWIKQNRNS
jgi:hypothetical protein